MQNSKKNIFAKNKYINRISYQHKIVNKLELYIDNKIVIKLAFYIDNNQ